MTRTLYDIGQDLASLNDLLDERNGEVTDPRVEDAITSWLGELASERAEKLDRYVHLIRTLEMEGAAATAEAEQYAAQARTREHRVKWLKMRLKEHLEARGEARLTTATGRTVSVQKNGGKLPVEIDRERGVEAFPERFHKVETKIDSEAIRLALEAGESVPGARLLPAGTHLRIR